MILALRSVIQGALIGLSGGLLGRVISDVWLFGVAIALVSIVVFLVSVRFFPVRSS